MSEAKSPIAKPPAARLPPPVRPGDRVGVAALSGPVDPERLRLGLDALERLGFTPVVARNVAAREGFFAGPDAERLAAFHELAADPTLAAILFSRGGHGVLRILPGIDWDLLAARPRAYVGFSDLTPFLLGVVRRLGLVAFHGPMVAADLARGQSPEEKASFLGALAGEYPVVHPLAGALRGGVARGTLLGGCLSLLVATLGTPYALDFEDALLLLEDVGEPPYRIDRMLTQLRLAGAFDRLAGLVVGHLDDRVRPLASPEEWRDLLTDALGRFTWPVGIGHNSGHRSPNWTLPLGLPAQLDAEAGRLTLGVA
ncbi:MAG TPA: LD-carboxypeptidase [Thermoanaerobaculia bacterium]|nr:LD-carboxypeptidase [Thermoanaerobaculia bacterium]